MSLTPGGATPLDRFLLALPGTSRIAADDVCVVVAHPDDESIGCGATLARLDGVHLFIITDGAPRDLKDARRAGFTSAEEYAAARWCELQSALRLAGIRDANVSGFGIPDQEAAENLVPIAFRLAEAFRSLRVRIVLTHAYEGGHPDHDASAFAVSMAANICKSRGQAADVIEMPFYRAGDHGEIRQSFASRTGCEVAIRLGARDRERKGRMIACFGSQRETLAGFTMDVEQFRPAPDYDFAEPANGGRLLYEAHDWKISAARWRELVANARLRLGEEGAPCRSRS